MFMFLYAWLMMLILGAFNFSVGYWVCCVAALPVFFFETAWHVVKR